MKRFAIDANGVGTYAVAEGKNVTVDMDKVFGYNAASELVKKALVFAVSHVFRNATAGKMETVDEALKAVSERADALLNGKWTAHKETGEAGESRLSILATALSRVMQVTDSEAAEFIASEVRNAMEEKGIDPDADSDDLTAEQKSERRKIANAVRKGIAEDPAVAIEVQKVKLERANAALEETKKAASGKESKFAAKK